MSTANFVPMVDVVRPATQGCARIDLYTVDREAVLMSMMRREYVPLGTYVRLIINDRLVMSDTRHEQGTNMGFLRNAHGRVLIAGLGIGMIVVPILDDPDVGSVTVVELIQDVIDIVQPQIAHPKLTIIRGDINTWRPAKGERFNTIYFDIWTDATVGNLPQIARLHRSFARYLDRNDDRCWMNSWFCEHLRSLKRRGAWRGLAR